MPRKSWWARLPFGVRMTAGTTALLVLVGGGVAGVATLTGGDDSRGSVAAGEMGDAGQPSDEGGPDLGAPELEESPEVVSRAAAAAEPLPRRHLPAPSRAATTAAEADAEKLSEARTKDEHADRTGPRLTRTPGKASSERESPRQAAAPPAAAQPIVTTRTDVETRAIPYDTRVIRDPSLPRGTRMIESPGEFGEETLSYLVTLTDGRPTARILTGSEITRDPEPRVVVFGARRKWDRDCEGPLRVCVPLGRSAICPADGSGEGIKQPADLAAKPEDEAGERRGGLLGTPVILTQEELGLLDAETLDRVRLDTAGMCR
ncbi:G5 domain-containing protein [Actinoplanes sp. CA-015351]|uniref:G5 domain-containing protein n=1 Tax=Actinoplanes sp. CA-015351 TaxID=3239897 RepID=UPI003D9950FF